MLVLRFWLAVGSLLALAAAGCAGSGGGDASGTGGEGGHRGSSWAPIGTYHFERDGAAGWPLMNLEIDPNGTFRWGFYSPEGGGNWRTLGDRLVLEPAAGKETFAWLVDFPGWGVYNFGEFERLEVVAGEVAGDIVVTGLGEQAFEGSSGQGP